MVSSFVTKAERALWDCAKRHNIENTEMEQKQMDAADLLKQGR